jgi:hypothetical protein
MDSHSIQIGNTQTNKHKLSNLQWQTLDKQTFKLIYINLQTYTNKQTYAYLIT